ncbi:MAG TPA: histidine kinase dimerization/phosphoacceptor domain -containing protein [Bryobacteraceae bacterium]|nr:histidine kinase dimerization/phosphoacceptor domain -containing protein [Bryobacteraceae bacterium]
MKFSRIFLLLCAETPLWSQDTERRPQRAWEFILILLGMLAVAVLLDLNRRLRRSQSKLTEELDEQRRIEAVLCQSDERHIELLGHLGLGFFQTSLDGRLLKVNQALASWAGYASPDELVAAVYDVREVYANPSHRTELVAQLLHRDTPITFEDQFKRRTGEKCSGRVTLSAVRDEHGRPLYLEGAIEDLTVLKRTLELADAQRYLGDRLATACNLSQALRPCLETAIRLAEMDSGEIFLVNHGSAAPVLAGYVGGTESSEASGGPEGAPEPVCTLNAPACDPSGAGQTVLARATVPILHEDQCIGWLVTSSHTSPEIPDFSRAALETIAAQISSAIARIQAQEALAASQRQLRALFDSLNDFLVITDLQGYILDANQSVLDRLGWNQPELRGKHLADVYSADLRDRFDALHAPANELGLVLETLLGGGAEIPVEVKLSPGIWDGQQVIIGVGRDLSERRKSEAQSVALREKTALLKEIHHRVKNNLQVISSLLSLQAARMQSSQERQPFRDSQARVQAMALLHEQLYQSQDLSRIDFGAYLGTLAAEILRVSRRSKDISLRLELQSVWVNSDIATPCGLIVNELITNSCKYAFPASSGEIRLALAEDEQHNLVLRIGDDGVGLPAELDFRKATTLGLQLVDDMVSQLKGSWTVEPSSGTTFRIVVPDQAPERGNGVTDGACISSGG